MVVEREKLIIIGGGAAGFFTAISAAEKSPSADITILERGTTVLRKVKVSGGGRCNVTHNCFDPMELSKHYPRGSRELRVLFIIGNQRIPLSGSKKGSQNQSRKRRSDFSCIQSISNHHRLSQAELFANLGYRSSLTNEFVIL